jgi:hypothetical protein
MGIFGLKSKTGDAAVNLQYHSGIPNFPLGWPSELILHDEEKRLEIRTRLSKVPSAYLLYDKIVGVAQTTEKEIEEKSKSVLGRAAIGGVLLGPVGALVGGMSGTGKKEKSKTTFLVIINYRPDAENEDIKVLSFTYLPGNVWGLGKFINMLKERAGISTSNIQSEINL